jgi:hypothetical protein
MVLGAVMPLVFQKGMGGNGWIEADARAEERGTGAGARAPGA